MQKRYQSVFNALFIENKKHYELLAAMKRERQWRASMIVCKRNEKSSRISLIGLHLYIEDFKLKQ